MVLQYIDYEIEIFDNELYIADSTDRVNSYDFEYCYDKSSTIKHGVLLKQNGEVVKSAILFGDKGQTSIHSKSAIVFDDMLIVCVSNKVFCLYLPSLGLRWEKEFDEVACIQIFKTSESYLIYGISGFTRINFDGSVIWKFSNPETFISKDSSKEVQLTSKGIEITDAYGTEYLLGYNGILIS
jgi:hypothetical protein